MLRVALYRVAVLLLRLGQIVLVMLQEAAEVVVGVGGAPVQADGLEVVLFRTVIVLVTRGAGLGGRVV